MQHKIGTIAAFVNTIWRPCNIESDLVIWISIMEIPESRVKKMIITKQTNNNYTNNAYNNYDDNNNKKST